MVTPLSPEDIRRALDELEGWEYDGTVLRKEYRCGTFAQAITFINRIAEAAEELDHHPELYNVYDRVRVELRTHSVSAVTDRDVELARRIEQASVV